MGVTRTSFGREQEERMERKVILRKAAAAATRPADSFGHPDRARRSTSRRVAT